MLEAATSRAAAAEAAHGMAAQRVEELQADLSAAAEAAHDVAAQRVAKLKADLAAAEASLEARTDAPPTDAVVEDVGTADGDSGAVAEELAPAPAPLSIVERMERDAQTHGAMVIEKVVRGKNSRRDVHYAPMADAFNDDVNA